MMTYDINGIDFNGILPIKLSKIFIQRMLKGLLVFLCHSKLCLPDLGVKYMCVKPKLFPND